MAQEPLPNTLEDKEFEICGYHVHKATFYVGIWSIVSALLVLVVDLFTKDYLISLDTVIDITTSALLIYGHSKQRRLFYIPFLVITVLNFVALSLATIISISYGSYCFVFGSACKHNPSTLLGVGILLLVVAFIEGLSAWIVWSGYRHLVCQANQPLPTLSFQNPTLTV